MKAQVSASRGGGGLGILLGLGVLGALVLGYWYSRADERRSAEVDLDRTVAVERKDLLDAVSASGRIEPLARVAVMSRASGIVKELFVEEGDTVEVGQVLAELDREQLEAQRSQDEAELASAQARLAAAQARLEEVGIRLEDPELEFLERRSNRLGQLLEGGSASTQERDDAERELVVARFRVTQLRASVPVLEAALAEAQANLESAQAALERSATALREATIRCPIEGVVLVRDKEVGDGISSILTAGGNATQLITLGDLSQMFVEARVDEVDLGRITVGMTASVTVDAYRDRALEGRVERIAPAGSIDENGIVTFQVRVKVEDPDRILKPDMTADVKLVLAERRGALVLPQKAFARGENGAWKVQRVRGEPDSLKVEHVEVQLGLSDGLITEILSGLSEGDLVLLPDTGPRRGGPP